MAIVTYLQVVTSQTTALQNERNGIDIRRRQVEASVFLVKAVGGGWIKHNYRITNPIDPRAKETP